MADLGAYMEANYNLDCSREELLKLLLHYEAELEQKEKEINTIMDDKAYSIINQAKYGKLMMIDPIKALGRDNLTMKENIYQTIIPVHEYQQKELEKLVMLNKKIHNKYKDLLTRCEHRHRITLDELQNQKQNNNIIDNKRDEEVTILKSSLEHISKQVETKQNELIKLEEALKKEKSKREKEKEDNKLMIKYLLTERKELFKTLQRMHLELTQKSYTNTPMGDSTLVQEMKKEIDALRSERNKLTSINQDLQKKNTEINHKLKIKEEDVQTLRLNFNKIKQDSHNRPGLVMANKGAITAGRNNTNSVNTNNRIPNSSTFPSTTTGNLTINQNQQSSTMYKRFPTILAENVVQRGRCVPFLGTKASNLPTPKGMNANMTQDIERLGFVVDSKNTPGLNNTITKRSTSLPRNSPQPKSENHQQNKPPSNIPVTRHHYESPRSLPTPLIKGKISKNLPFK